MNRSLSRCRWSALLALMLVAVIGALSFKPAFVYADDHEKIDEAMDVINTNHKKLKKQVTDAAQNKASIQLVREMQTSALVAKACTPQRAAQTPEAQRPAFLAGYQKSMIAMMGDLLALETALIDGKNADADALLKKLEDVKKKGHELFQVE